MTSWAYLFEHPGADPDRDRMVLDGPGTRAIIVAVPSASGAGAVAAGLAAREDLGLVELCGGFTSADVARVVEAVGPDVAVGHVTFPAESLGAAARYAASFAAGPARSRSS